MDYSTSIHEDHPAGASPWGNSPIASPQHSRATFGASADTPTSPTPYSAHSYNGSYSENDIIGGGSFNRPDSAGATSVTDTSSDGRRPDTAESVQSSTPDQHQPYLGQIETPPQQQYRPEGQRVQPQRYHTTGRQIQPSQASLYKLHAKITGLERTGRKDPILRFDVHVSVQVGLMQILYTESNSSDQSAKVPHDPIPRCPSDSFRIH